MAERNDFGVSFAPTRSQRQAQGTERQIAGVQQPIQVLNLRLPKFVGGRPIAPAPLLRSRAPRVDVAGAVLSSLLRQAAASPSVSPPPTPQGPAPVPGAPSRTTGLPGQQQPQISTPLPGTGQRTAPVQAPQRQPPIQPPVRSGPQPTSEPAQLQQAFRTNRIVAPRIRFQRPTEPQPTQEPVVQPPQQDLSQVQQQISALDALIAQALSGLV